MLVLLSMFGKTHLWSHLVQDFCLWEFFITALISLVVICLLRFSDSTQFCFRTLFFFFFFLKNICMSPGFSNLLENSFVLFSYNASYFLVSVLTSLSFLILFGCCSLSTPPPHLNSALWSLLYPSFYTLWAFLLFFFSTSFKCKVDCLLEIFLVAFFF